MGSADSLSFVIMTMMMIAVFIGQGFFFFDFTKASYLRDDYSDQYHHHHHHHHRICIIDGEASKKCAHRS